MKRYIKNCTRIEVEIQLDYERSPVAAGLMSHPKNIRKQNKLSEIKLAILDDIVTSTVSVIQSFGFQITRHRQSKKSYTYYIQFIPITDDGQPLLPVEVLFRISGDHSSNTLKDNMTYSSVIVKSVLIGDKEYNDPSSVILAIQDICNHLKEGDQSILYKYKFSEL